MPVPAERTVPVATAPAPAAPTRREQIVDAAFRCVAESGIAGLRMRDVAREAGVNIATVHYHLSSKTDLVRAVVARAHDRFAEHAAPPDLPAPRQRLRAHLDAVFGLLDRDPALARVLAEVALEAAHDSAVAEAVATAETTWRGAVQAMLHPLPARRARPLAALVVLVVKGACLPPADAAAIRAARRALDDSVVAAFEAD
ncbi:TetR/AcrR family transcriptional regulator [Galbitalea sp. SE-J8]|uniref:TetR/AcrR family transcriptional regulator n=1 Tax=Galbitalea sp. SE-J8 TaxID=3054952 RepID=UPI00259CAAE1|nr:TetR/AcrR family transcriptional regulator [Galbitalea sp. SE-J8]MDM4763783.1 TetR/AcrR family transcriptional regulator [Galbitalea sp. SE-J8]